MLSNEISIALDDWILTSSGLEIRRNYLGMSKIGSCPYILYKDMIGDFKSLPSLKAHARCRTGYLWEEEIKRRLADKQIFRPGSERPLVAMFDKRFVGHTDGEFTDGNLLEIKTVGFEDFKKIISTKRLPVSHFWQVQAYMHHGNYQTGNVVYICTDSGEHYVYTVYYHAVTAQKVNARAKLVLDAFDKKAAPPCECGHCKPHGGDQAEVV